MWSVLSTLHISNCCATTKYVARNRYIKKIWNFIDTPVVKVLVGMRRVGKSVILKMLIDELIKNGAPPSHILYINKESLEFDDIKNYRHLYQYAKRYFAGNSNTSTEHTNREQHHNYIFVDEIQEIEEWEKAVASFSADQLGDVIISGSNANLLSTELATLLSGRYVEIPIHPLIQY